MIPYFLPHAHKIITIIHLPYFITQVKFPFLNHFLDKPFFTEAAFTFFGAWAADISLPVSTSMSLSPSPKFNGVARAAFSLRISNENK